MTGRFLGLLLAASLGAGCLEPGNAPAASTGTREGEVFLGTVGDGGLDFVPFVEGGDLPLETFGQGGTHVTLSVRCVGFGNRAFVTITLRDPATGIEVRTPDPPSVRPNLLPCDEENPEVCDAIPIFAMTAGLAPPAEKDGLRIEVVADVRNSDGVVGQALNTAVLRMQ